MTGLETNVLVRYFAQDDSAQSKKATALGESFHPFPKPLGENLDFILTRVPRRPVCIGLIKQSPG